MSEALGLAWRVLKDDEMGEGEPAQGLPPGFYFVPQMLEEAARQLDIAFPQQMEGMGIVEDSKTHQAVWVAKQMVENSLRVVNAALHGGIDPDKPLPGTEPWLDETTATARKFYGKPAPGNEREGEFIGE